MLTPLISLTTKQGRIKIITPIKKKKGQDQVRLILSRYQTDFDIRIMKSGLDFS